MWSLSVTKSSPEKKSADARPALLLQKVTTQYVEVEDRVRMTGEVNEELQVVLWFSQRLLGRLLPPIIQWLEKSSTINIRSDIYQGFVQQAAAKVLEPQRPVLARPNSGAWLVCSVDLTPRADELLLTFRGSDPARETVAMQVQVRALRQWLNIVYEQYKNAGWPSDLWPSWMHEARGEVSEHKTTVLH